MAGRPQLTIVCLLQDRILLRVDRQGGASSEADVIEDDAAGSAASLRHILEVRRPAARVVVLRDDLWCQTVELAEASTSGLGAHELQQALSFEVEPMSNMPAVGSRTGYREGARGARGKRSYWVSQASEELVNSIEAQVKRVGSRLVGIAHPCGLGLATRNGAVTRVEIWDQVTFCGTGSEAELVIAGRAGQRFWTQKLGDWMRAHAGVPAEWAGSVRPAAVGAEGVADLGVLPACSGVDAAAAWLRSVAHLLEGRLSELLPVVVPAPRRIAVRPSLVMLLLTLAAAVALWFDDRAQQRTLSDTTAKLEQAQTRHRQIEARSKGQAETRKKVAAVAAANDKEAAALAALDLLWQQQRNRVPAMLRALAALRPKGLQVRSLLSTSAGGNEITGIATEPKVIDDFAAQLAPVLRSDGWDVSPAHSRERAEGGRAWHEFTIGAAPVGQGKAVPMQVQGRKRTP